MTWKVYHVDKIVMIYCLDYVNENFKNNIEYIEFRDETSDTGSIIWQFLLRTIRQDNPITTPGYMLTRPAVHGGEYHTPLPSACWHVRKAFYDELPDEAVLKIGKFELHRDRDEFPDWEVKGWLISNLCHCKGTREEYRPHRKRGHPIQRIISNVRIKGLKGR